MSVTIDWEGFYNNLRISYDQALDQNAIQASEIVRCQKMISDLTQKNDAAWEVNNDLQKEVNTLKKDVKQYEEIVADLTNQKTWEKEERKDKINERLMDLWAKRFETKHKEVMEAFHNKIHDGKTCRELIEQIPESCDEETDLYRQAIERIMKDVNL
ncbi:MAG TPA: hypothetical protein VLE21_05175 [Candidatus Nitrosocosmicus sp.]|nr:hypothetical protein [Candidatus Nitrosocosmicus sp.]